MWFMKSNTGICQPAWLEVGKQFFMQSNLNYTIFYLLDIK
jgi:hypothetical protein